MSDNLNIRKPQDPTKVNVNQSWEVEYWCQKWNISSTKLREAVGKVGVMVKDIERYLGK